jgi:branched-chain amino acid transport system ATP-binding protein
MDGPLLSVEGVCFAYGKVLAITGLDLTLDPGSSVAVLGPNGAGKSTTARLIAGLLHPDSGQIRVDGRDVSRLGAAEVRRLGVCYLPEGRGVFPGLSVRENLRLAARLVPRSRRAEAIEQGIASFPILGQRSKQQAASLSGGEQQMLALARVAVCPPRVIVADELSLGLAPKMVDTVFESLERFKAQGVAVVLIEQFVHRALAFADTCVVLSRGRVAWRGSPEEAGAEVLARYLGQAEPV